MGFRFGVLGVWLGIVGALSACGSQSTEGAPLTLEGACRGLKQSACAAFQRCSPEHFAGRYPDLASCVSVGASDCVERGLAPGSTVTPAQVEACAEASSKPSCERVLAEQLGVNLPRDPACVWQGTLREGEACIDSGQCASGTCSFFVSDACGTCLARADESCVVGSECLVGSRCVNGLCRLTGAQGATCDWQDPCAPGLSCRSGQCQPPGQAGDSCGMPDAGGCAPDLWCNEQAGICEHSSLAQGSDACGVTDSGSHALCAAGTVCAPDAASGASRCVSAPAPGEPCGPNGQCGVGLKCYESSCQVARAAACVASSSEPNSRYPAQLPSVPQCVAPAAATLLKMPKVVLLTFAGDARAPALESFVKALGSSSFWRSTTSEYGIGELSALPAIRVKESPPRQLADGDVRTWLTDQLATDARFPQNDGLTLYVVAYPKGVAVSFPAGESRSSQSCTDFGGYHGSVRDAQRVLAPYAVIVDCDYSDVTTAIAHEAVEAVTDPFAGVGLFSTWGYLSIDTPHFAWALPASGSSELADLCWWQPLSSYVDPETGGTLQRSWSNAAMAGFHQPCVPARPAEAYFNAVPHIDNVLPVKDASGLRRTRGIAIALGESRTVSVDLLSDAPMSGPWRVSAYDLKQWRSHAQDPSEPTLRFSFDKQSGVNGDALQMTITALRQDPDFLAEPFVLVSRRGRDTNVWVGVVGQP